MKTAAAFLIGYSMILIAMAWGLHWLGRRSRSAWADAGRPQAADDSSGAAAPDWPHSEVPKLHAVIGAVAAGGSMLLSGVGIIVAGAGRATVPLVLVLVLGLVTLLCLLRPLRRSRGRASALA